MAELLLLLLFYSHKSDIPKLDLVNSTVGNAIKRVRTFHEARS